MASRTKKTRGEAPTVEELQKQVKTLQKRLNDIDNDLDSFDKLTRTMENDIMEIRGSKFQGDLIEKIDVIETIYGEAVEYNNEKVRRKTIIATDADIRRILVEKGVITRDDLHQFYLKDEFKRKPPKE